VRGLIVRAVGFRRRLGELDGVLLWDGRGRDLLDAFIEQGWATASLGLSARKS
jgi:hypothetical protein